MDTLASICAAANTPDSSCLYDGCTDPVATNYDATANNDDGSCYTHVHTMDMMMT